jgi:hypothetical protein
MEQGRVSGQNLARDRRIEIAPIGRLHHSIVQAH